LDKRELLAPIVDSFRLFLKGFCGLDKARFVLTLEGRVFQVETGSKATRGETTMSNEKAAQKNIIPDDQLNAAETVRGKLTDAMTPGFQVEFDPEEAERVGAFTEDALSEQGAAESSEDLPDALAGNGPGPVFILGDEPVEPPPYIDGEAIGSVTQICGRPAFNHPGPSE
jgi:hypothetical protein